LEPKQPKQLKELNEPNQPNKPRTDFLPLCGYLLSYGRRPSSLGVKQQSVDRVPVVELLILTGAAAAFRHSIQGGYQMESHGISKTELKELMKEALISVLTERKDLLQEAVSEAILDMKLGLAMEEGDTGEYVPESEVLSKLTD